MPPRLSMTRLMQAVHLGGVAHRTEYRLLGKPVPGA